MWALSKELCSIITAEYHPKFYQNAIFDSVSISYYDFSFRGPMLLIILPFIQYNYWQSYNYWQTFITNHLLHWKIETNTL